MLKSHIGRLKTERPPWLNPCTFFCCWHLSLPTHHLLPPNSSASSPWNANTSAITWSNCWQASFLPRSSPISSNHAPEPCMLKIGSFTQPLSASTWFLLSHASYGVTFGMNGIESRVWIRKRPSERFSDGLLFENIGDNDYIIWLRKFLHSCFLVSVIILGFWTEFLSWW